MLLLLSPAKSLDLDSPLPPLPDTSIPRLLDRAEDLVGVMRTKSPQDLRQLMGVSEDLAVLNVDRFQTFDTPFTPDNARPAGVTFAGDVYQGLAARDRFDEGDWQRAQTTLRILSGLYGLLRPLDLMQPYRLEMGTRLTTDRGASLYDYWGDTLAELVQQDVAESPGSRVVVDLASEEYAKAARLDTVDAEVVRPRFLDEGPRGGHRVISFHAKRARGEMAAWAVLNRAEKAEDLHGFDAAGYRFDPDRSQDASPVFVRDAKDRPGG